MPAADSLSTLSTPRDSLLGREAWAAWIEDQQALGALEEDEAGQLYALYERLRLAPLELNTLHEEELRQLPFLSDYQIYQLLRFRSDQGQVLSLGSLSYHWHSPQAQLRLEGELAYQSGGGWALAQHLSWGQGALGDLGLGYWRLSPSYWNSLGRGLEHAAWVHGEEGARLYWQLPELLAYTRLTLQAEAYHPLGALRRGQREGGHWSWVAELRHQFDAAGRSFLRLWWRRAQRAEGTTSRLRLQFEHSGRALELRCGLQLVPSAARHAWALYTRVRTQLSPALRLELGADYFDAPSWQQRLYGYLPRGRHSYAPQLLYGRGYDLVLRLAGRLGTRWQLEGEASYQRQFVSSRPSPMHYALSCIYRY